MKWGCGFGVNELSAIDSSANQRQPCSSDSTSFTLHDANNFQPSSASFLYYMYINSRSANVVV